MGVGLRCLAAALWVTLLVTVSPQSWGQVALPPSANCHVTDGSFTKCPGGTVEWSDVQPLSFPATDSFLYVNQDSAHTTLYLMYDFPVRTARLGATDSVHVSFNTVEQVSGAPKLIVYDIYILANGTVQILQQGQPTPPGHIIAAAGFGASPNSSTPHVTAELQVPLVAGPPSTYSPDPLYWSASLPPTPPPPPCPTQPGKYFSDCTKKLASAGGTVLTLGGIGAGVGGALCTAGTIGACVPAETALVIGGGLSAAIGYLVDKYIAGDPPGLILTIPPDSNYTVIAQPAVYSVAPQTQGVTPQEASALTAWYNNMEQAIAVAQAGVTSVARAEGASAAGNPTWVINQGQAAQQYGAQLGVLLNALPTLEANVAAAFQAAGSQGVIIPKQASNFLSSILSSAPPSEIQQEFALAQQALTQLGFSSDDLTTLMQVMQLSDPTAVSTLGNGTFPQSLTDPTVTTTLGQLSTGLTQNQPSQLKLTTSFNVTLPGDYVATGVGLRGATSGTIKLSGIPAGATVLRAFLYWGMLDNGLDSTLSQLAVNGTPISGSLIGSGPDTCWGDSNSFTFRAEVTPLVSGNGTYQLTGVASGGSILADGASLVVIYQLAGAPVKTVILDDGNLSMPYGTTSGAAAFTGFTATAPVSATTTFMVGDGQAPSFGPTPTSFTGSAGTLNFPNLFASLEGNYWDSATFNVSSAVAAGSSPDTAQINISGDCLLWSAQAFSVSSAPATAPLIGTAAFVEAGQTGNTVATQEGLAAGNAPTLQTQIQDIVQFRITQNRGLVGTILTTQLVNGLVSDGILTTQQAATIQSAVVKSLVLPPVPKACDVNGDGQIDKNDVTLITAAVNTPASGPNDPRDADRNGVINALDARKCVTLCTNAGCGTQ
jgi:Dockerin type I domain